MNKSLFAVLFVAMMLAGCTVNPVQYVPITASGYVQPAPMYYYVPLPVYYYGPGYIYRGGWRRDGKWWRY